MWVWEQISWFVPQNKDQKRTRVTRVTLKLTLSRPILIKPSVFDSIFDSDSLSLFKAFLFQHSPHHSITTVHLTSYHYYTYQITDPLFPPICHVITYTNVVTMTSEEEYDVVSWGGLYSKLAPMGSTCFHCPYVATVSTCQSFLASLLCHSRFGGGFSRLRGNISLVALHISAWNPVCVATFIVSFF